VNSLSLAGRFQRRSWQGIDVLLDVAHNPAATALLARNIESYKNTAEDCTVTAVFAMLADKDIKQSLRPLLSLIDRWLVLDLNVPRAASPETLALALSSLGVAKERIQLVSNINEAFSGAERVAAQANKRSAIVIGGSFFTVTEGLEFLDS